MANKPPFRLLRSAVVTGTVLGLATGAHLAAGGLLPGPLIVAALGAFALAASVPLTRIKLSLPAMAAVLLGSQLLLHTAFDVLSAPGGTAAGLNHHSAMGSPAAGAMNSAGMHSAAGMDAGTDSAAGMGAMTHLGAMVPVDGVAHAAGAMPASGWMLAAHLAATLISAVLLAKGEAALWALADWLRPLHGGPAVVVPVPALRAFRIPATPLRRRPWRNLPADRRRGPPAQQLFAP